MIASLPEQAQADIKSARELHVSTTGDNANDGSSGTPLLTISAAAALASPGDTVIVHAGIYREQIDPPRGGISNEERITYRAAQGEHVEIRGSEIITGWEVVDGNIWKVTLPNSFFGDFNPYSDLIKGDWFNDEGRPHHTGMVYQDGQWLVEAPSLNVLKGAEDTERFWFAQVDDTDTMIWANFREANPNDGNVEINVRQTVFYPRNTGISYLTVSGFALRHAATPWAPPTAEQIGLIGTNWSKGWIIENNTITDSRCVGVTLGKYGDKYDNTSENTASGYVETVEHAHKKGWNRDNIGSHIVRNNNISHCEQAGIVGSLGAIFSEISGNVIHDIHIQKLFSGEEQAGIKFHAPIDTVIRNNHIYRTHRAMWMDWMTQGTRISCNLCHDSDEEDIFIEVNHGPFIVDNNLFLSRVSLQNWSQGGAYLHNLFGGEIRPKAEHGRETPYHPPHSTEIAGITNIPGGDDKFINNMIYHVEGLSKSASKSRDARLKSREIKPNGSNTHPTQLKGNLILEQPPLLTEAETGLCLKLELGKGFNQSCDIVTSDTLGRTVISESPFRDYNGAPLKLDADYHGEKRNHDSVSPGPFVLKTVEDATESLSKVLIVR